MAKEFGKLILIVADQPEQEFVLTQEITTIGSAETNDIVIKRAKVSRAHARIECTAAGCTIFDLESVQGTVVNNQPVQQINLASGDVIKLGEAELRFEILRASAPIDATILDAAIFAEELSEPEPEPEPVSATGMSALVTVQPGGNKLPFFCVTGRYGDVPLFETLAHHLGPEQPFYAIQPPKPSDGPPPFTNLDALAAHYIEKILGKQPQGPYYVGGFNVGGLVAFEVAQQLQASGREVAMVALIDTPYLVKNPLPYLGYRLANSLKQNGDKLFEPLQKWAQTNVTPKLATPVQEMRTALQSRWPQPVELAAERMEEDYQTFQETLGDEGYEAIVQVLRNYQPKTYSGKTALFLAAQSWVRYSGALWGWQSVAPNGLDVHTVPGSYISILREPHVQILAKQLAACLAA